MAPLFFNGVGMLLKKLCFIIGMAVVLTACAQQPVSKPQPLVFRALSTMPPLAAEYETVVTVPDESSDQHNKTHVWYFWRDANRIETLTVHDNTGDVWEKNAHDAISYLQLFHDQHEVIEYLPGDLATLGLDVNWTGLATLMDADMQHQLMSVGTETVLGRQAVRYQSQVPEHEIEVLWLEAEQLPALIKRLEQGHVLVTTLKALYPLSQSSLPRLDVSGYRFTDFSDIGDKESDPVIKTIMHKIKGSHRHEH